MVFQDDMLTLSISKEHENVTYCITRSFILMLYCHVLDIMLMHGYIRVICLKSTILSNKKTSLLNI